MTPESQIVLVTVLVALAFIGVFVLNIPQMRRNLASFRAREAAYDAEKAVKQADEAIKQAIAARDARIPADKAIGH